MPWIAAIAQAFTTGTSAHVVLDFAETKSNELVGGQRFTISSREDMMAQARNFVAGLDRARGILTTISVGETLDLAPVVQTPEEIAAEQARIDYFLLVAKRAVMQKQIAAGALKPDDALVTDLEAQIKAAFRPEYV